LAPQVGFEPTTTGLEGLSLSLSWGIDKK